MRKKKGKFFFRNNNGPKIMEHIKEFKELFQKAKQKHGKTARGVIEKTSISSGITNPSNELIESVYEEALEEKTSEENNKSEKLKQEPTKERSKPQSNLTEQDLRDIGGVLKFDNQKGQTLMQQLKALDIQMDYFEKQVKKSEEENNEIFALFFREGIDLIKLKREKIRLKLNLLPDKLIPNESN